MLLLGVVDVGAEIAWVLSVDMYSSIVKSLTPRSVCGSSQKPSVSWRELDAQVGAFEAGAERVLNLPRKTGDWNASANDAITEYLALFSTSKYLRVALCTSRLPEMPPRAGAGKGSSLISSTVPAGMHERMNQ